MPDALTRDSAVTPACTEAEGLFLAARLAARALARLFARTSVLTALRDASARRCARAAVVIVASVE